MFQAIKTSSRANEKSKLNNDDNGPSDILSKEAHKINVNGAVNNG